MYVAARGGEGAIQNAEALYRELIGSIDGRTVEMITRAMPYLVDRVMGEGSLYSPELAALALAQSGGDLHEAVLMLRAYRSTLPRIAYAQPVRSTDLMTVRRISAAFKDVPGGQILGPTLDYSHRLLQLEVLDGGSDGAASPEPLADAAAAASPPTMSTAIPFVAEWQREAGLLDPIESPDHTPPQDIPDVTREPLMFPPSRAARLQSLSRAETGGVLALGYANMRGYGAIHPTINELRLGYADVTLTHPISGATFSIGRIRISQAEVVTTFKGSANEPKLALGFCATMGWNEVKTIAGSMLDMAMDLPVPHPSHTEEYVLYHTDPIESSGFCIHYKLPHYVTFGSSLDAMRAVSRANAAPRGKDPAAAYYADDPPAGLPGTHAEDSTRLPDPLSIVSSNGHAEPRSRPFAT